MENQISKSNVLIITLASIAGLVLTIFSVNSSYYALKSKRWPTTDGIIIVSEVEGSYRFTPKVVYTYKVGDEELSSDKIRLKDMAQYKKRVDASKVIEKYPLNGKHTVYYNPQKPKEAILEPGIMGEHIFMFLIGIIIFLAPLIGLIYSIRKTKSNIC